MQAAKVQAEQNETDRFNALVAAGKESEKAANFTNAMASYREALTLRPTNAELTVLIRDLTAKADQQNPEINKTARLRVLDDQLEILMVTYGLLKPAQAKSEQAKEAHFLSGGLSMEDVRHYLDTVSKLRTEFEAGGWLNQERAEKIKKLVASIKNHAL